MGTCLLGYLSLSVGVGKARCLACGLVVSGLTFEVGFWEIEAAHTKMSHICFVVYDIHLSHVSCVEMVLWLFPKEIPVGGNKCGYCLVIIIIM